MREWTCGFVMAVGLVAIPNTAPAQTQPGEPAGTEIGHVRSHHQATITIWVLNQANVSQEVLLRAKAETARIYNGAGVAVLWRNTMEVGAPGRFIVNVVSNPLNGTGEITSHGVMGMAPGLKEAHGMHAWAFYANIQAFAALHGLDAGSVLGYVIAHEIGHLLLRDNSHSQTGIMRAGWDKLQVTRAAAFVLTFTPKESALIRSRLVSSNPPAAAQ